MKYCNNMKNILIMYVKECKHQAVKYCINMYEFSSWDLFTDIFKN